MKLFQIKQYDGGVDDYTRLLEFIKKSNADVHLTGLSAYLDNTSDLICFFIEHVHTGEIHGCTLAALNSAELTQFCINTWLPKLVEQFSDNLEYQVKNLKKKKF